MILKRDTTKAKRIYWEMRDSWSYSL